MSFEFVPEVDPAATTPPQVDAPDDTGMLVPAWSVTAVALQSILEQLCSRMTTKSVATVNFVDATYALLAPHTPPTEAHALLLYSLREAAVDAPLSNEVNVMLVNKTLRRRTMDGRLIKLPLTAIPVTVLAQLVLP